MGARRKEPRRAGAGAVPQPHALPALHEALIAGLLLRTAELARAWRDLLQLAAALEGNGSGPVTSPPATRSLHVDHGKAVFQGASVGIYTGLAGVAAILLGWPQAALVGIAMAGPANFAFLDDPRPAQILFLATGVVAVPVAALYLFAIFPAVDDVFVLLAVLAPMYFLIGVFMASPRHTLLALGFVLNFQTLLALQLSRTTDFVSFMPRGSPFDRSTAHGAR